MRRNLIKSKPANTFTVSPSGAELTSIQTAIDIALENDLILVYPGTYNEQLILKNGVNIHCFPGVTISSDSESGTITDNDNPIIASLSGFPNIVHVLDSSKRIILQQADSLILDFYETLIVSTNFTLHFHSSVLAYADGDSFDLILPDAKKFTGKNFLIKKLDSSENTVTVLAFSDQQILGGDHYTLDQPYAFINLVSDGSNWF